MPDTVISLNEAAKRAGVSPATLKRWAEEKVIPVKDDRWTNATAAQARVVARMRERGHSLKSLKRAVRDGRLSFGFIEELFPSTERTIGVREAAERTGLEPELIERLMSLLGTPTAREGILTEQDVEALDDLKRVLESGFPLVALLQLVRVYAQSLRKIAEAEVRLFHLFVHEPLIRDGVEPLDMAEEMEGLAGDLLPLTTPLMEYIHTRYLRFYLEQDVVGHMEDQFAGDPQIGRISMAFCFVDITGFTRYTEEEGDEEALDLVERFVDTVEETLPSEATIVKTIGDEVMIVSPDPVTLTEWAVGFLGDLRRAPAAAHRGPLRRGRVPRRRLLRQGRQPRPPRRRARGRRRGDGHALGRGRDRRLRLPRLRADRRGGPQGARVADRAVRRAPAPLIAIAGPPARRVRSARAMGKEEALSKLGGVVAESGLVDRLDSVVVLISGGADSACTAAALVEHCGRPHVHALHLNYGLRVTAADDESSCRRLCAALRIDLRVERPEIEGGNLQAEARAARYEAAESQRERSNADWVATGHTMTDAAETLIYRLAVSPGRRALLGLPPRRGRVIRPLLGLAREESRSLAREAGLPFSDDPTNLDPKFARNRIRNDVLPVLRKLNPAAERNIAETRAELGEEAELLERLAAELLAEGGAGTGVAAIPAEVLAAADPALRRIALRVLAERTAHRHVPLGRERAAQIWRLAQEPEGGQVDARRRAARGLRAGHDPLRARRRRRARAGAPARPRQRALRRVGASRLASRRPGPARGARAGDARRDRARARSSSCARGARATASARSAWTGRRRCRTSSPTARCRARCATSSRSSPPATASPGSPGSRSPRTSASPPRRARPS